jgi:hypothetical protein
MLFPTHIGRVAVLVHWYDGTARFDCNEGEAVPPETLIEERLQIGMDEIVWVRR